jgi:hypothetical protein
MARAGDIVADTLAMIGEQLVRVFRCSSWTASRGVHPRTRRRSDLEGLPRLPGDALHLSERDDRARDPY